jgi:hypothetical protein
MKAIRYSALILIGSLVAAVVSRLLIVLWAALSLPQWLLLTALVLGGGALLAWLDRN